MAKRYQQQDLVVPYLKTLFYGQPGSTKTRTVATAAADPRLAPVLMLEAAGNPVSIRSYEKLPDIIHMEALADFNEPYEWLAGGQQPGAPFCRNFDLKPPYKTVVVDGLTEVQRFSFNVVTGNTKIGPGTIPASVEIQHFNKVLGQMVRFANLYFSLPMNVLMTSLEREDKDEVTGMIMYKPLLWGQSAGEVPAYALLVGRLVHRERVDTRTKLAIEEAKKLKIVEDSIDANITSVALFLPSGKYVAKDQYGMGTPYMVDPSMAKIYDKILATIPEATQIALGLQAGTVSVTTNP